MTHEDQIPVVEIDDTYSCLLMQDFLWFTKVGGPGTLSCVLGHGSSVSPDMSLSAWPPPQMLLK